MYNFRVVLLFLVIRDFSKLILTVYVNINIWRTLGNILDISCPKIGILSGNLQLSPKNGNLKSEKHYMVNGIQYMMRYTEI